MSAEWFSAIVACVAAIVSLIFSLLSFTQARFALKKADQALDLERASSAVTHYLAAIGDSEKLHESVRAEIGEMTATVRSRGHRDEDLRILVLQRGDRIIADFESLLVANRDMIEEEIYAELRNGAISKFKSQIDLLFEMTEPIDPSFPQPLTGPLSELAYWVNRYTGYLRKKVFERRSKLTGIQASTG